MTRLRTLSDLQDALDSDHAWRLKEIMNLRLAVRGDGGIGRATLVRAGVALLYAHWEGFIKCASLTYLEFVGNQRLKYEELSDCFVVFGAKRHLASLTESKSSAVNIAAVRFFLSSMDERANLNMTSAVNTESNLSSTVFENIATSVGVDCSAYESKFNLIDESLLKRRNHIAHGEYLDINSDDFIVLADAVTVLMRTYLNDVSNAASTGQYRRQ